MHIRTAESLDILEVGGPPIMDLLSAGVLIAAALGAGLAWTLRSDRKWKALEGASPGQAHPGV